MIERVTIEESHEVDQKCKHQVELVKYMAREEDVELYCPVICHVPDVTFNGYAQQTPQKRSTFELLVQEIAPHSTIFQFFGYFLEQIN
jgi:hypothetical protein